MSKIHNVSLPVKYFEPIRKKEIKLLIFERKVIDKFSQGDKISLRSGGYEVEVPIGNTYIKSFGEITEKEAKKAGFLNKDFLKDELICRFKIDTLETFLTNFDSRIFFFIDLTIKGIPEASFKKNINTITIPPNSTIPPKTKKDDDYFDFFGKKYKKIDDWTKIPIVKYNMEYYEKPWRDDDEEI